MSVLRYTIPDASVIKDTVEVNFNIAPCKFQLQWAGKTLTFWIPLLFNNDGMVVLITALNGLSDQNINELQQLGISVVNLTGANATDSIIQLIVASPELIINDRCFNNLWRNFRPEYSQLGRLRWLLPSHVPFHIVSATLPSHILKDVSVAVIEMLHSANSFHNINHILRLLQGIHPLKFMIFCNSRQDSQRMAEYLHSQLHPELQHKIIWFHSRMMQEFRTDMMEKLHGGKLWGMCCTDAVGMGLDIRDVELVVQWGYISSLCTLMQRLGRAARDPSIEASSIYFVEKDYKRRRGHAKKVHHGKQKARVQQGAVGDVKRAIAIKGNNGGRTHEQPEGHERSDSSSESDGDELNDTIASYRNTGVGTSTPTPSKLLPSSTGLCIEEYEVAAMEAFIDAGNQTICRCRITDEYFGNNLIDELWCSDAAAVPDVYNIR
ncbi:P-loop containing nucleoside triphosphate hydrolase protein [Suillus paluster]|uniref:P-loop containing nucleoside triphosphate hydrolase protein n=1 Tax=Suillus paluster TaxID=48578 RepID=UPI001B87DF7B|nr:P-loop containing nucleoside triphosphate hydrolase protein [Suillus paluster]KAG1728758.1 P-loop containing nucleoside triphosphate hydrolase protein [Suillus paluster]